jgi:hypothetical protein
MKIRIEEALKIYQKYGKDQVPIIFLSDVFLNTGAGVLQISQGMPFDETQYDLFVSANVFEIDVIFTDKLLAKLIANYPDKYRYPWGRLGLIEMDRLIENIEDTNRMTKHKRKAISCTEIYRKNTQGLYETILGYGEKLIQSRWNEVKTKIGRSSTIDYRFEECGIIVFVILKAGDPDYMRKFMNNTELVSLLVEHKADLNIAIAPDLNPNTDIYTVNDPKDLLQVYTDNKTRLVIVGDELNDEYKIALAKLKHYDRYARMMVVKKADPSKKREIIGTIKKVYMQEPWELS